MTTHMNEDEIQDAIWRFGLCAPHRAHVAGVVLALARWTNEHSDGWPYWQPPRRAAAHAMEQIRSTTTMENVKQEQADLTEQGVRTVLRPISAFCTRMVNRGLMTTTERDQIFAG